MAASLNTPSNFNMDSNDDIVLLPPSTFETLPAPVDPWKALAKATGEILDLKHENTKLKGTKQVSFPLGEEIKARVDLHHSHSSPALHDTPPQPPHQHPPPPSLQVHHPHQHLHQPTSDYIQLSHYHDLINRQAAELVGLQQKLSDKTTEAERDVAKLESQLALKDSHYSHKVAVLEERLRESERQVEEERSRLQALNQKWESDHTEIVRDWRAEVARTDRLRQEEVTGLQDELEAERRERAEREQELVAKINNYILEISSQQDTLSKLQTYVSENENSAKSTEIWRRDTDRLKQNLQDKEVEISKLESEIDLLKIRLTSQNEILTIQEKDLSKAKDSSNEKKKQCLLTRWREKVYALLVQLKCAEIVRVDQERQWKNKVNGVETELESCQNQLDVLQCAMKDKQAELDIEKNTRRTVEEELIRAQQVALRLDDQTRRDKESMEQVLENIKRFEQAVVQMDQKNSAVLSTLSSHNQRIAFASGRIEFLQSQFARKEALLRLEMEQKLSEKPTRDVDVDPDIYADSTMSLTQFQAELSRVTEERDMLAAQIKADARMLENKVSAAKEQVAEEVENLKHRLKELHIELDDKSKLCTEIKTASETGRAEHEEAMETIDTLKAQLAKAHLSTQQEVDAARSEEKVLYTDQLAAMEHKLNEARREHTKAVVSLRQLERQQSRDKERAAEHLRTVEEYYKGELAKTEAKCRAAETDRNLFMTTLRQEGLMGKAKAQRAAPVTDPDLDYTPHHGAGDSERPSREVLTEGESESHRPPGYLFTTSTSLDTEEPLHQVIDDLRSLTRAVMDEDGANSDEVEESIKDDTEEF